ncbi:MAG TPA: phosphoglycolate phosphatase [Ideonella sp.]|uniref:phosphoglycolate phosphatase n=1 Tax=Ideonella sp. TaxID=1929293 RepID=UPI002E3778BE|nr:phosphoglycolate phosphatase [Ideonella sp.]HEX5682473.1 phosphoglycolate phosphatase [Ideonella sp.]
MSGLLYDAAMIDLDGTLVDTVGDFEVALARMLADLGLPAVGRPFIERTVGQGSEHLIRETLAEAGGAPELYAPAWVRYQHHYEAVNGRHSAIYPGVPEGLAQLRSAGLRLACLTNKPVAFACELLRHKGLSELFEHCFGGDSFERKKPDPLPLRKACEALGSVPSRTLMVGDSRNDVQAARGAGCPVVLVRYGYNHGEPAESAGADRVVDRLDEITLSALVPTWP